MNYLNYILFFLLFIILYQLYSIPKNKNIVKEKFTNIISDININIKDKDIQKEKYNIKNDNIILEKRKNFNCFNDIEYDNYANPNNYNSIINDTYSSSIPKTDLSKDYSSIIENKQYCIRPELDICAFKDTKTQY